MQRFIGVASGKQSFREHCATKMLLEANPRNISASKISRYTVYHQCSYLRDYDVIMRRCGFLPQIFWRSMPGVVPLGWCFTPLKWPPNLLTVSTPLNQACFNKTYYILFSPPYTPCMHRWETSGCTEGSLLPEADPLQSNKSREAGMAGEMFSRLEAQVRAQQVARTLQNM